MASNQTMLASDGACTILAVDDRISCQDSSMAALRLFSYLSMLFCISVPIFFAVVPMLAAKKFATNNAARPIDIVGLAQKLGLDRDATEDLYREIVVLPPYLSALKIQAYHNPYNIYWGSVDCLRKLALLLVVDCLEKGTASQHIVCSATAFLFLMMHVKICPYKSTADNMFQAASETHIFWIITIAFLFKMDLARERLSKDFYGWLLLATFVAMIPVLFCAVVVWKFRFVYGKGLFRPNGLKGAARRHACGMATSRDRDMLRRFFASSAHQSTCTITELMELTTSEN